MRILALEPYYGGSHRAFLDGWTHHSRHDWTLVTLPPRKWKWRMRHAALTTAMQVRDLASGGASWDAIFATDMLNLAEFRGLCGPHIATLPAVLYFHENQLTYPVAHPSDFDYHFAFSNLMTAAAADRIWFNSAYHRSDFERAMREFLQRMPDYQPLDVVCATLARSEIQYPGLTPPAAPTERPEGPLHILWAARWEFDKQPERFFDALRILIARDIPFRVSVLGGGDARNVLPCFEIARNELGDRVLNWGYMPDRSDYEQVLGDADAIVSTAAHEFFGIGVLEAVAAGAFPVVPRALAYPEVLGEHAPAACFHDGSPDDLAQQLISLAEGGADRCRQAAGPLTARVHRLFAWPQRAATMDDRMDALA